MTHHLLGAAEIATLLGVTRQRVAQLAERYADFPKPEARLATGRVWSRASIEHWIARHPDRRAGRTEAATMEAIFTMPIDDMFEIKGRGIVVTGKIDRGILHPGDHVQAIDDTGQGPACQVLALERFRQVLRSASAGENVGVLLADIDPKQIKPGMRLIRANA